MKEFVRQRSECLFNLSPHPHRVENNVVPTEGEDHPPCKRQLAEPSGVRLQCFIAEMPLNALALDAELHLRKGKIEVEPRPCGNDVVVRYDARGPDALQVSQGSCFKLAAHGSISMITSAQQLSEDLAAEATLSCLLARFGVEAIKGR